MPKSLARICNPCLFEVIVIHFNFGIYVSDFKSTIAWFQEGMDYKPTPAVAKNGELGQKSYLKLQAICFQVLKWEYFILLFTSRILEYLLLLQKIKLVKMKTLTLSLPDSINELDVRMQLAAQLFEKGIISAGQAADLAVITKRDFIENVGKYGVSIFGENIEDLDRIINE